MQPIDSRRPLALELDVGQQNLMGCRAGSKERHKKLDALIGALVVVVFRTLNDVKEPIAVIWDALKCGVDAILLPRIIERQDTQQEV